MYSGFIYLIFTFSYTILNFNPHRSELESLKGMLLSERQEKNYMQKH